MAKLSDVVLLELARREATKLFQIDRNMEKAEHQPLAEALSRVWKQGGEWS
jgi:ATP-dependent DNA helicase RecG